MPQQELAYKVNLEINNDVPTIKIGVKFYDLFTKDFYALVSEVKRNSPNLKKIPFTSYINGKTSGSYLMENNDVIKLIDSAFSNISDYDFHKHFNTEVKEHIKELVEEELKKYEHKLVRDEIGILGEVKRMKQISNYNRIVL